MAERWDHLEIFYTALICGFSLRSCKKNKNLLRNDCQKRPCLINVNSVNLRSFFLSNAIILFKFPRDFRTKVMFSLSTAQVGRFPPGSTYCCQVIRVPPLGVGSKRYSMLASCISIKFDLSRFISRIDFIRIPIDLSGFEVVFVDKNTSLDFRGNGNFVS